MNFLFVIKLSTVVLTRIKLLDKILKLCGLSFALASTGIMLPAVREITHAKTINSKSNQERASGLNNVRFY